MKSCQTCGRTIDPAHPFNVCPRCLFAEALEAGAVPDSPAPDAPVSAPPGRPFAPRADFFRKYQLIKRLDSGGQGDVWEVWDAEFRRRVAMKRLSRHDTASAAVTARFFAEAQIASQLEHPGILPIFDVGLDPDGRPFYTTQLLPKRHLGDIWAAHRAAPRGEWPLRRALELLLRVCDVMAYAHGRRVIHRDLKPPNILVGPFGDVRVIDWGSARVLGRLRPAPDETSAPPGDIETDRAETLAADPASTQSTARSGQPITVLFAPPELLSGNAPEPSAQTDLYSMGVILYELLAGRPPYARADGTLPPAAELRQLILAGPPRPVRAVNPSASRDLAAICARAMDRDPAARYATMERLAADLRAFLEIRPVAARNPGPLLRLQKLVLRNLSYVFLGTVILAGAAIALSVSKQLTAQRDAARLRHLMNAAQLDARSGRWTNAVSQWLGARALPGHDPIEIALRLSEAHIVLSDKPSASNELAALVRRTDLGPRRGAVLLRAGEHEMFDRARYADGVRHVREALSNQLDAADTALAAGLLADSTVVALGHFRDALRFDPYSHAAHRHSLGLEFILGRHDDLSAHLRVVKSLFPGDFSPSALEICQYALRRQTNEMNAALADLRARAPATLREQVESSAGFLLKVADFFEFESLIGERTNAISQSQLLLEVMGRAGRGARDGSADPASQVLPSLPSVHQGMQEAMDGVKSLMLPALLGGGSERAVEKIKAAWRRHPEALFPVFAAIALGNGGRGGGAASPAQLQAQAELYQMGADSPSILPDLSRVARAMAALIQCDLALSTHTNARAFRAASLENFRRIAADTNTIPAECRIGADSARALRDFDLARQFLARWERLRPGDRDARRRRVLTEHEAGAYPTALKLLDRMITNRTDAVWAGQNRSNVVRRLEAAARAARENNP